MKAWPSGWRVRHRRDPERKLRRLQRGFRAVSRRADRARRLRRFHLWAKVWGLPVGAAVAAVSAALAIQPWPPMTTVRHVLAVPNCAAARLVGLAPARQGQPGYWPQYDADRDGIACEPWRGRRY